MSSEEEIREWELLPSNVSVITSPQMSAWLYYRDKRRDERVKCELLDKVLEKVKEHHYPLSDQINSTDYGMFTVGIEQVIVELKEGIEE